MTNFIKYFNRRSIFNPYVIAEIGVNHEGSLKNAKKMINLASKHGASAVKFQTYKAETLASKNSPSYWDLKKESTKSQFLLFKKYDTFDKSDYVKLSNYCKSKNIDFLSTPFDLEAVDFLDNLVKYFKVASADLTNYPLLERIASKKKPIILSLGASTITEIKSTISFLEKKGCKDLALLHCILNYPTINKNANLEKINFLINNFGQYIIGYSDHTMPDDTMSSLVLSSLKGAKIIEKHFTFNKKLKGNDHYHAMDYLDLKKYRKILRNYEILNGQSDYDPKKLEKNARLNARRSIVLKYDLKKNTVLKKEHLIAKRPGTGISPKEIMRVIGKKTKKLLKEDHLLTFKDII